MVLVKAQNKVTCNFDGRENRSMDSLKNGGPGIGRPRPLVSVLS